MKVLVDKIADIVGSHAEGLKACIEAFNAVLPFDRVLLFGSYARGDNRTESDVDLCVIAQGITTQQAASRILRKAIGRIRNKPALSIIPISPERLHEKRLIHDPFYETILREGVCLAEKD